MSLNKFLSVFFIFLCFQNLKAQKNDVKNDTLKSEVLQEMVVTATRTQRQLSSVPLPVTLVSKKDIEKSNTLRLNNILQEQTGVNIVNDHGAGVQIQGMNSDYVMIMIDGFPLVGRTAGTFDLERVAVGNIQQIEIVKGASSSLYGSEAMAGVINIITSDAKDGFHGNISGLIQTNTTQDFNLNLGLGAKKFNLKAFVNRNSSEGFDSNNTDEDGVTQSPFESYTSQIGYRYQFNKTTDIAFSARGFYESGESLGATTRGDSFIVDQNYTARLKTFFTKKISFISEAYYTNYFAESFTFDRVDASVLSHTDFDQDFLRAEGRLIYKIYNETNFLVGGGLTHESLERTLFSNKPVFNAPYIYGQYDWVPSKNFNLIIGARYDAHSAYRSQFNPKFSLFYRPDPLISFKGSMGRGYKAPDFRTLYLDFTNPSAGYSVFGYNRVSDLLPEFVDNGEVEFGSGTQNSDTSLEQVLDNFNDALEPESSTNLNLSFTLQPLNNLVSLTVNGFYNHFSNLIDSYAIARKTNNQSLFSYRNFDDVITKGVEVDLILKPLKGMKLLMGYQYLKAYDKAALKAFENGTLAVQVGESPNVTTIRLDADDYQGLPNRSKHIWNVKAFYEIPNSPLSVNIRTTYRSKFGRFDTNGNNYLDRYDDFVEGYALWNLSTNYQFNTSFSADLGLNNLFDYTNVQLAEIPGRLIFAKLNYRF